ncbi:hypothetical protein G7046_g8696 [Stylonectria norvegica]|nr:hypothetical protein G7046_g8696 [Stylonectria norvegica]
MRTTHLLALANVGTLALAAVDVYGQCGGRGYSGDSSCVSGTSCIAYNEWYSQCITPENGGDSDAAPTDKAVSTTQVSDDDEDETKTTEVATSTLSSGDVEPETTEEVATSAESSSVNEDKPQTSEQAGPTSAVDDEPTTTVKATATAGSGSGTGSVEAPTAVTRTLPASSGAVSSSTAIPISGTFDGGMKLYDRSPSVCEDQTETGEKDAMFILEDGATIQNVIIGPNQAEGIHCLGTCTLINVWWADVCEDALTLKQESGTSHIIGGGAFHAADKIVQFNGRGTVEISNFYAEDYGKLVRSCGNCDGNGGPRNVVIDGVAAVDGGVLCGINTNYGDTCTITNSCQDSGKSCDRFEGNDDGSEPEKIGSGPDGTYCSVESFAESC